MKGHSAGCPFTALGRSGTAIATVIIKTPDTARWLKVAADQIQQHVRCPKVSIRRLSREVGDLACQMGEAGQSRRSDKDPPRNSKPPRFSIVAQPDDETDDPHEAEGDDGSAHQPWRAEAAS